MYETLFLLSILFSFVFLQISRIDKIIQDKERYIFFYTINFSYIIYRINHYPRNLISFILCSLVNLDKLEKRHRNTRKDSDASTSDDNASSKISRRSNKGKGKQTMKETEESLMDHLKKVENNDPSGIQTIYSSDESIDQVTKVDAPVSNEALLLEADRTAKQNLLHSSDSETGKQCIARRLVISFCNGIIYV